ncbi:MAG: D-alanine--D-alanine ligase [Dysgonamonadaceae bacterium]|jgi:D-alanine-D-alanine ligase|nr:D-alanine--D-alanine ligase [Dysgonamonadaceae bacterium]
MRRKKIAIVWGGYSSEREVSARSAKGIYSFIDKSKYKVYMVKINRHSWKVEYKGVIYPVDKNTFSFTYRGEKKRFDFAYITVHGTPGEDGTLQGYLDMQGIPYSNCGVLASALTFSKFTCNRYLASFGVQVADSLLIRRGTAYDGAAIVARLGLPVFVKPNVGGSSFATTKVKEPSQLQMAIKSAFEEAPEVIVESFVPGTEVTCGCFKTAKGLTVLPLTEVMPKNEFFDYKAKYRGQVQEITPARIPDEMTKKIQDLTAQIYDWVGAKGIIRADFIVSNGNPVLLEVNTTPGMTVTSFIPQQVVAAGLSMKAVLDDIIEFESIQETAER